MATVLPNVPTDSLYKFLAIFGIFLFGLGLWLPPERFLAAEDRAQEARKARQLAKIRVDRKKVRADQAAEEYQKKSAVALEKVNTLSAENAALSARSKALVDELDRIKGEPTLSMKKNIMGRSDAIMSELKGLQEKSAKNREEQRGLDEELKSVRVQMEEVEDELNAEMVELKSLVEATEGLNEEAKSWLAVTIVSMAFGVGMMAVGFRLWYARMQVFQDGILRRQAGIFAQNNDDQRSPKT